MKKFYLKRNKIVIDDKEYYISNDIIYELNLIKKESVSEEEYRIIIKSIIKSRALYYLSKRDYLKKELKYKLETKFFVEKKIIEEIIDELEKIGYIDDRSFIKSYIKNKNSSIEKKKYELSIKGAEKKILEEEIKELREEIKENEYKNIRKNLRKVRNREKNKQIEYLMRKGFKYEDIKTILKEER
ncbi:regulatory protein [Hypnocyclicus thermotrophus]|uniref:Regulatory protein RecX n=1 Tax=Hypnocyclicus thermotrophus TaxID=1627895 RepID=A0AA46DYA6_9FUSO|nr:RecX family transcriptional regulator [Hypnocyclicus thermotrophus]TDT69818.1 regulatory protein [Hypnocyclicus thermotrophus]